MFKHLNGSDMASLVLRLALAVIFLFHGGLKVSVGATEWNPNFAPFLQAVVAWGEVAFGAMCLLGLVTRFAATGIILIMAGAIWTVTGKRDFVVIKDEPAGTEYVGFNRLSPGYEYNVAIIAMAFSLAVLGGGPFSVDRMVWGRTTAMVGVLYLDVKAPQSLPPP